MLYEDSSLSSHFIDCNRSALGPSAEILNTRDRAAMKESSTKFAEAKKQAERGALRQQELQVQIDAL